MNAIEYLKFIILAIIQGITEVLPISSSGHLQVAQHLLGMDISNMSLSIFLHFGSLFAVIIYFRSEIKELICGFCRYIFKKQRDSITCSLFKTSLLLIISSLPAAIAGMLLKETIEAFFDDILYIGISLLITAILLITLGRLKGRKSVEQMTYLDATIIGVFQAIGIVPGISRSGITLTGAKARHIQDVDGAKYAFLMFIPVALGSGLLEIIDVFKGELIIESSLLVPYLVGITLSGLVTYISLKFLLQIIKKGKMWYFSFYCFFAGIAVIIISLL